MDEVSPAPIDARRRGYPPPRRAPASSDAESRHPALGEALLLVSVVLVSFVPYLTRIGFYSDDWAFIAAFKFARRQSLWGYVAALMPDGASRMRPVASVYRALLFDLFGAKPLGYHLVNAGVLVAVALLFWLLLRAIGVRRDLAFAAAALYAVMPNYSTLRFWYAAFTASLSLALFLISALVDLRAVDARRERYAMWRALSLACLVLSLMAYELVLPLFVVTAVAVGWSGRERPRRGMRGILWGNLVAVALVAVFKARIPDRFGEFSNDFGNLFRILLHRLFSPGYGPGNSGLHVPTALEVNFVTYGLLLPRTAWKLATEHADAAVVAAAVVAGLLAFAGVYLAGRTLSTMRGQGLRLAVLGGLTFVLGYAIFLTNGNIQVTATGTGNRTAAVAALGVALVAVGLFASACRHLPVSRRRFVLALSVGCFIGVASLVTGTISIFWRESYQRELEVLRQIQTDVPQLPGGTTLILDGVCRYRGPAPVFEACWDLEGALRLRYGDPTLRADIVNPTLTVEGDGIHTSEYDTPSVYPYGSMIIYNYRLREAFPVGDRRAADDYFATVNPNRGNGCRPGFGGWGEPVL